MSSKNNVYFNIVKDFSIVSIWVWITFTILVDWCDIGSMEALLLSESQTEKCLLFVLWCVETLGHVFIGLNAIQTIALIYYIDTHVVFSLCFGTDDRWSRPGFLGQLSWHLHLCIGDSVPLCDGWPKIWRQLGICFPSFFLVIVKKM